MLRGVGSTSTIGLGNPSVHRSVKGTTTCEPRLVSELILGPSISQHISATRLNGQAKRLRTSSSFWCASTTARHENRCGWLHAFPTGDSSRRSYPRSRLGPASRLRAINRDYRSASDRTRGPSRHRRRRKDISARRRGLSPQTRNLLGREYRGIELLLGKTLASGVCRHRGALFKLLAD